MRYEKYFGHGGVLSAVLVALVLASPVWAGQPKKGPLKVFLMAGQSNMEGQAEIRTIDFLGEDPDPQRAAVLKKIKPDGKTLITRDDVWIAYGDSYGNLGPGYGAGGEVKPANKIGPEYAFGYFMGEALGQQVLLIKVATGGTSLNEHWRPPSAGLVAGAEDDPFMGVKYKELVGYTRRTLKELKKRFPDYDEKAGYEIAGFVWFQGFNDMFDGENARKQYGRNLLCLIKDLRKDLNAPEMKVVVGVMGVNGPRNEIGKQKEIRDGHRFVNTVPEFKGNVKAIESAPFQHPTILEINCAGKSPDGLPHTGKWLYPERDLEKNPVTPQEQAMLNRATSNLAFHYFGEGRFFILLGKAFAETMQELMGNQAPVRHEEEKPAPRFIVGSGTASNCVTDTSTGLMWLKNPDATKRNIKDAIAYCKSLDGSDGRGNYSDWRLPNVRELQSVLDFGRLRRTLPEGHPFTGPQIEACWSDPMRGGGTWTGIAWHVVLTGGGEMTGNMTDAFYVWPVRGGSGSQHAPAKPDGSTEQK